MTEVTTPGETNLPAEISRTEPALGARPWSLTALLSLACGILLFIPFFTGAAADRAGRCRCDSDARSVGSWPAACNRRSCPRIGEPFGLGRLCAIH